MRREKFPASLSLRGRYIELVPLAREHAAGLQWAARAPEVQAFLRHRPGTTLEQVRTYLAGAQRAVEGGESVAFSVRWAATGGFLGMTGYHHIDPQNDELEIGGTWLDSDFWRTPVNTDAKLLLLRHAFEEGEAHRVWLQTDRRNERSQRAISALGATREAELREDVLLADGTYRTSVIFGILRPEWPEVKARLTARLERPWTPSPGGVPVPPPVAVDGPPAPAAGPTEDPSFREGHRLEGRHVELVPLGTEWVDELAHAGRDPAVWRWLRIGPGRDRPEMTVLVHELLDLQRRGVVLPFVIRSLREGRAVGLTRFLDIDRANRRVEIGTWIDSEFWRTPINTEAKLLMLGFAFDAEGYHRVQLRTDLRNERSQQAISRLGAVPEGVLREHIHLADGHFRSSVHYSILAREWPDVRTALEERVARPWPALPTAPP